MFSRAVWIAWLGLVAFCLTGCGVDNVSTAPIELEEFCPAIASAVCRGNRECCSDTKARFDTDAMCRAEVSRECKVAVAGTPTFNNSDNDAHDWPDLAFDGVRAASVVAQFQSAARSCTGQARFETFQSLFSPFKTAGETCGEYWECVEPNICRAQSSDRLASKACAPMGGNGDHCTDDVECEEALRCVHVAGDASLNGTCGLGLEQGELCAETSPCAEALVCLVDPSSEDTAARCSSPLPPGAPCDSTARPSQCGGGFCDDFGLCQAWRAVGEACSNDLQCASLVCGGVCLACSESNCVHQSFLSDIPPPPIFGTCVEGVCRFPIPPRARPLWPTPALWALALGEVCLADGQCSEGVCTNTRCALGTPNELYCQPIVR